MKYQVTETEHKELSEDIQALYGDDFKLKIEGLEIPDVSGLKKKVDDLLAEKKTEQKARKAAEKQAADDAAVAAQKSGDVDAINASWQTKYDDSIAGITAERDEALSILNKEKVHSKALEMATTLAIPGSASLLMPVIEPRLSMEIKDGRAVTSILDIAGKPSAQTFDELSKEIASNPAHAPVIVASNAAGGGANGNQRGGAAQNKTATRGEHDGWNTSQRATFFKEGGTLTE